MQQLDITRTKAELDRHGMQTRMVALINELAPTEGLTYPALDGVKLMRASRSIPRSPVLYEPCIVIVCQGRKTGYLGDASFIYDAQQFLVLAVPLPFESETIASPEEPLLAVAIRLNLAVIAELLLALDDIGGYAEVSPKSIAATPMDAPLAETVLRLLQTLTSPIEAQLLGPSIMREIFFRVLAGPQGGAIRAALAHQSQFGKIAKALRRIHSDYPGDLDVAKLADEAGMSVPAFHANFKAVTATSPIQYVKTTRLHKARLLMVQDGITAAVASTRVGYESASQFSREFKRFFGRTPLEEARLMKSLLGSREADSNTRYVSVQ
ncbi:MAG TPA: AraC family transcriptional regulator [Dongiaceae bacterium]